MKLSLVVGLVRLTFSAAQIYFLKYVFIPILERPRVGLQMPPIRLPFSPQIVGGDEAEPNSYPFIVSLQILSSHFCAGSVLNESWIITAGHCVQAITSLNLLRVKAGKHNIERTEESEQTVSVSKSFVHESYGG